MYNGHGDVIQLTNSVGTLNRSYDYDTFGNEKNIDPNDNNPFRYCGEYFDKETSTYYLRARYYDPTIGRFITEDSNLGDSKDPLSLNLYTYCYNNPIYYIDPTGFRVSKELGLGGYSGPPSSGSISSGPEPVCQPPSGPAKISVYKVVTAVGKVTYRLAKTAKTIYDLEQFKDEHLEQIKLKKEGSLKTVPYKDYTEIYDSSLYNRYSNKVMLGKYDAGGSTSYIQKARDGGYSYFDLGEDWGTIETKYKLTDDDMFKLFNESFLDDGINAGKSFTFSHNPVGDTGALGMEHNYLKQNGYVYNPSTMTMTLKK